MTNSLRSVGMEVRNTDELRDIINIHEAVILKKTSIYNTENNHDNISIPEQSSTYLKQLKVITNFHLRNGGQYISDTDLNINEKIEITYLLAALVDIDNNRNQHTIETYKVLPEILIKFSTMARQHSGYRLCKRAIRHALDPQAIDIFDASGSVVEYNGNKGLMLVHKIKASMKSDVYKVKLAFTRYTIISCECTCKAGSFGQEKVVCVHVLPVLLQVTHFLFKYMAESILIELANAWKNINESAIELTSLREMKFAVETLIIADDVTKMNNINNNTTINELLQPNDVGTEKAKLLLD